MSGGSENSVLQKSEYEDNIILLKKWNIFPHLL